MKKEKKYLIYGIALVLVTLIGVSLSYFVAYIEGDKKQIGVSTADLKIIFNNGEAISGENIKPGWSITKTFSIENRSDDVFKYNISIEDLVNTFVTIGYLQYKITSSNGYNMTDYKDIPKSSEPTNTMLAYSVEIANGEIQEYTIEMIYKSDDNVDQSDDMGAILNGKLYIEVGTYPDLAGTQVALDNVLQSQIPSFNNYNNKLEAKVNCKSGNAKFNYKKWVLESELGSNCSLTFKDKSLTKIYLNDYIISLNNQEVGDGIVTNENGYRYEGSNPNNYILFNNELWRIIGVFDQTTHGVNSSLVKIIRNDDIGGLVYNTANSVNSWGESTLYKLLNQETGGSYYTGIDYTNKSEGTYCSGYSGYTPQDCTFSKKGIRSDFVRNMIEKTKWYSTIYSAGTASETYAEDTTTTTSIEGYIGLMYLSDYEYAVKASECARTISLTGYYDVDNKPTCVGKNWLHSSKSEWTLSRFDSTLSYTINGSPWFYSVNDGHTVRPSLYLKSNVYYVGGSGTYDNPIIIGQ